MFYLFPWWISSTIILILLYICIFFCFSLGGFSYPSIMVRRGRQSPNLTTYVINIHIGLVSGGALALSSSPEDEYNNIRIYKISRVLARGTLHLY